jgi:hypothetical protein
VENQGSALHVLRYTQLRAQAGRAALKACACSKRRSSQRMGFSFAQMSFSFDQSMLIIDQFVASDGSLAASCRHEYQ